MASVYKVSRVKDRKHVAIKSFKNEIYFEGENGSGKLAFLK